MTKPIKLGVRAIILNNQNEVLLVKHSYINGWYLPGGGVHKNENVIDALKRELHEELSITCDTTNKLLGIYINRYEVKIDYISVFVVHSAEPPHPDRAEIAECRFFPLTNLPTEISIGSKKRLLEYQNLKDIDGNW